MNEPVVTESTVVQELSVEQVLARLRKVKEVMEQAMQEDHHYGVIPGTKKPTLLKPGMELLCLLFRLDPQYSAVFQRDPDGHLTIVSTVTLWHIPTGQRWGSGMGSCSTRESKFAYRKAARACPRCGKETIIKGKAEYGGGWLCWMKAEKSDGCGAKFADADQAITSQQVGRVVNEDIADQENTVLKVSNKRGLGAAVLNVTAASDLLTVDLEDMAPPEPEPETHKAPPPSPPAIPPSAPPPDGYDGQPVRYISEKQGKRLFAIAMNAGVTTEALRTYLLTKHGLEHTKDIPASQYETIVAWAEAGGQ